MRPPIRSEVSGSYLASERVDILLDDAVYQLRRLRGR